MSLDSGKTPLAHTILAWFSPRREYFQSQRDFLRGQGYQVFWTNNLASLFRARRLPLDLILIDLEEVDFLSLRLMQKIRRHPATRLIPILILSPESARPESASEILKAGADDCIPKPVLPEILLARMEAALNTARQFSKPDRGTRDVLKTRDGRLILNIKAFRCQVQLGLEYEDRKLTRKEFRVLSRLLKKTNQTLRWQDFMKEGWQPSRLRDKSRTLVQHIMRLRQKLGVLGRRLETVSGVGYRWND